MPGWDSDRGRPPARPQDLEHERERRHRVAESFDRLARRSMAPRSSADVSSDAAAAGGRASSASGGGSLSRQTIGVPGGAAAGGHHPEHSSLDMTSSYGGGPLSRRSFSPPSATRIDESRKMQKEDCSGASRGGGGVLASFSRRSSSGRSRLGAAVDVTEPLLPSVDEIEGVELSRDHEAGLQIGSWPPRATTGSASASAALGWRSRVLPSAAAGGEGRPETAAALHPASDVAVSAENFKEGDARGTAAAPGESETSRSGAKDSEAFKWWSLMGSSALNQPVEPDAQQPDDHRVPVDVAQAVRLTHALSLHDDDAELAQRSQCGSD